MIKVTNTNNAPSAEAPGNSGFFGGVALPIVLALLCATFAVVAIFTWSNSSTDQQAINRQMKLVEHVISHHRDLVKTEQADMAIWDAAVAAVSADPMDIDFVESNLGEGAYEFFGHDQVFILDPKLRPIYAMVEGDTVSPQAYAPLQEIIEPLAARLKEISWRGAINAFVSGANTAPPNVTDVVMLGDRPAFLSLMPILSDKSGAEMPPGREYIHISAQYLDEGLAKNFSELLLLDGGHFTSDPRPKAGTITVAVSNAEGMPIAYYCWMPYQPSVIVFKRTLPIIILAMLIAGTIISMLLARLRRSTRALELGRSEAQHLAFHDALTGLGNRISFERRLTAAIQSVEAGSGGKCALLLLDLDRFKQVNDTLGHEAGDELICEVAERLLPLVRGTDTVVRLGGDEFGIVAQNITSTEDLAALSNRILVNIRRPFDLRAGQAFVGVSIGISIADGPDVDPVDMTREADIALYEAKGGGRNQYRIFEEHMSDVVRTRQDLEADLRAALRTDDQLDVSFEPLVREDGNEVIGAAARLTWQHPSKGLMAPDTFMPVAETSGLSEIIGEFVLLRACQMGAKTPGQLMTVRTSAAQLRNPFFFDKVFSILNETGMRPQDLELEINEKILASSEEITSNALRKLRHAGVGITLDDFGVGFTSLRLLQKFEVDRIKMDSSFIKELEQSPDPEAITHAVIWLARAIGVEVSADGVDTMDKKNFLARMGCMSFQGALFSPEGQAELLRTSQIIENGPRKQASNNDDIEIWDQAGES